MKNRSFLALILAITSSPSMAQQVKQSVDKFSGDTTYSTTWRGAHLEGGSFFSMRYVNFQMIAPKLATPSPTPMCIAVMTQTEGWVFISSGESLILKLDGSKFLKLSGLGSLNQRSTLGGNTVLEQAVWCAPISEFEEIAAAKSIEYRVIGDNSALTGSFDAAFVKDIAEFVRVVPPLLSSEATPPAQSPAK